MCLLTFPPPTTLPLHLLTMLMSARLASTMTYVGAFACLRHLCLTSARCADRNVSAGLLEVWVSYLGFNVYSKWAANNTFAFCS